MWAGRTERKARDERRRCCKLGESVVRTRSTRLRPSEEGTEKRIGTHDCRTTLRRRRLAAQPAKHLGDDTADGVVELGGHLGDERREGVEDVGAQCGVGEVERGDEEGDELQEERGQALRRSVRDGERELGRTLGSSVRASCLGRCCRSDESAAR